MPGRRNGCSKASALGLRVGGDAASDSYLRIDKLIDALVALRSIELPSDPLLGTTHYTIGVISGGVALFSAAHPELRDSAEQLNARVDRFRLP